MSLILQPASAPSQLGSRSARGAAQHNDQECAGLPSFCDVFFRSLSPGAKRSEEAALTAAGLTPARRQTEDGKDAAADTVNALAMTLVALDASSVKTSLAGPQVVAPDTDPETSLLPGSDLPAAPASTTLGPNTSLAALTVKSTAPSPSPDHSASRSASTPVTGLSTEPLQPALPKRAGPASGLAALRDKTTASPDPVAVSAPALVPVTGSAARSSASDAQTSHGRHPKVALSAPSPATLAMSSDAHGVPAAPTPDSDPAASLTRGPELRGDPASTILGSTTSLAALTVKATTPSPSPDDSASESASVLVTGLGTEPLAPAAPKRAGPASSLAAQRDKTPPIPDPVAVSAPALAPAAGSAALSSASDAQTSHGRHPKVALSTSSPATLAMSSDAHGAPAAPTPDSDPAASLTRGPELRGDPASTSLAATTTLAAMTVKPTLPSASPTNKTPLAAAAALTGLDTEPLPVPVPGRPTEADTSAPQADTAPQANSPAVTAEAGTSAGQASASANSMPGADTFSSNANWLTNPLSATTASNPTGVAVSNTADSLTSSPLLTPEVGSKEWDKALGQQVVQLGKAGHHITELQLNPPGLGPLKVTLEMNHHQMQVMFVSAHASVRAAVEAAVPQLRASLADSGISLGNTSVSSESQAQTAFAQPQNPAPRHQAYRNNSQPETPTPGARALAGPRQRGAGLGVDTYA